MYKFIKNNQKKMLAVFGVLLMVVFIIPPSAKSGGGARRRPVAYVGKTAVYSDERAMASAEWDLLTRYRTSLPFMTDLYAGRFRPGTIEPWRPLPVPYVYRLGLPLATEIQQNPELYFLLQKEAEADGIEVSDDQANTAITNDLFGDRGRVTQESLGDAYPALLTAVKKFLPVLILHDRVGGDVRVTSPMWKHMLGDHLQQARLSVVELTTPEFTAKVGAPTTQQVQEQYDKFHSVTQGSAHAANDPLGFGYGYPDRVKIQYLSLPHKLVSEAARSDRKPYDWEVDARMYYYAHLTEFVRVPKPKAPSSQPTTLPTTEPVGSATTTPSDAPASQPATAPTVASTQPTSALAVDPASTQPSTRPFVEVQTEIMDKIVEKPATELEQKITDAITARLQADYHAHPSTAPASAPTTLPAEGSFTSKEYLDQVALDIQKQFGVLPTVVQIGEWKTAQELGTLTGIGTARNTSFKNLTELAMPEAASAAEPGVTPTLPLADFQPSQSLKDLIGNVYIFRISARSPAHAPDFNEVKELVSGDVITSQAYAKAVETAKKIVDAAKTQTLAAAAIAAQVKPPFTTRALAPGQPIAELMLSTESQAALGRKTTDLLGAATPESPHPVSIVELPADRKVLVIQLAGVQSQIAPDEQYLYQFRLTRMTENNDRELVVKDYFAPDLIKARINYRSEDAAERAGS